MTARQFYIMLFITTISLKVQKLPSLIYDELGKDGYLILFAYFVVDFVGIMLAFYIRSKIKGKNLLENSQNKFVNIIKKCLVLFVVFYFILQALLLYESIQNLFEHILFDNLSWVIFSLLLIVTIYMLVFTGIKNIARNFELYFFIIMVSYVLIAIIGATKADFTVVLPLDTICAKQILSKFVDFNLWFGDFFLVLFMSNHTKKAKLKWTLLVYTISIAFLTLLYIELNGIYGVYTGMKPTLISTITEQSMLGVNIGRVDWFLILFTEVGTILSCGVCLYFAKQCLSYVFPKLKKCYAVAILLASIYALNVFYLLDIHMRIEVFTGYLGVASAITKWGSFILMLIACLFQNKKQNRIKTDKNTDNLQSNTENLKNGNEKQVIYEK